ncbi:MAG TPA: YlxR family protein [Proteobacteria bacterium]|nr:YlxR family protein [Pseudomonadota bacterium]
MRRKRWPREAALRFPKRKNLSQKTAAIFPEPLSGPLRSCLICRQKTLKNNLCRFVKVEDRLVWDRDHRAPGRGHYLCKNAECLGAFLRGRRRLSRQIPGAEALTEKDRLALLRLSES